MTATIRAKTMVLGIVAGGLMGAPSAATALADPAEPASGRPAAVANPLPGLLGVVPCLITTGSALFCTGIT
ncbi:hypothetical protein [Nocardia arizonensis]|uniref:hypothetical protein n=1 Tax=Nocardia arizonensis TaxID=1141647 RepID=UPI0006D20F4D|nr:hypothetical protein [Nocardia arizonensis]